MSMLRRERIDVREELFAHGERFTFLQAMRLLRYFAAVDHPGEWQSIVEERVRLRPKLALAFPGTDLHEVEILPATRKDEPPRYRLTLHFLGLYGAESPLPDFYTEDLIDDWRDDYSASRDFIDIFNHPLYQLLFRCFTKYREHLKIGDEQDFRTLEVLYAVLGFGTETLRASVPEVQRLLRYLGLFNQFPRSAAGLRALLRDAVGEPSLDIEPCVPRRARIPQDQLCLLGRQACNLGLNSYLGEEIPDRAGKITIVGGPLDAERFHRLLPDRGAFDEMKFLYHAYAIEPLACQMRLTVAAGEARTACCDGERWNRLGWSTWLFSGETYDRPLTATFQVRE